MSLKENDVDLTGLPELPRGWSWVKLAVIAKIDGGITKDSKRPHTSAMQEVPYLRVANVQRGFLDLAEVKTILADPVERESLRLQKGDVLFTEGGDRDKLGRGWVWNGEIDDCIHQNHVFRARPNPLLAEPKFISFHGNFFGQKWFARTGKQTTNLASINKGVLSRFPVPLAPLNEQRRIIAKVEELFSDLDAGVAALARAKANLKRYRAAVLKAAVEGKLTEESPHGSFENAAWIEIGTVFSTIEQGWSPKCDREPATSDDEWAVMKTSAVLAMQFLADQNKRLPNGLSPKPDLEVQTGDLLITRAGPRNRAAVTCLVRSSRPRLIVCDKVYRMRCDRERASPAFLEIVLNTPDIVDELDVMKTGISDSGVNLTQHKFRRLKIPLPPVVLQERIVSEVQRHLSIIAAAETEIEHSLLRASRLRQSILKQAFEGKLVPQDPHDEPASVLLERLNVTDHAADCPDGDVKPASKGRRSSRSKVSRSPSE